MSRRPIVPRRHVAHVDESGLFGFQGQPQVVARLGVLRIEAQRFSIVADRLVQLALRVQRHAQVVVQIFVVPNCVKILETIRT